VLAHCFSENGELLAHQGIRFRVVDAFVEGRRSLETGELDGDVIDLDVVPGSQRFGSLTVWVANWQLRGHRRLIGFATVRLPAIRVNVSPLPFAIVADFVRRLGTERAMDPAPVVIAAERRQLSLEVHRIPEQSLVQELSAYRSCQAFNERMTQRTENE
jgi:hypothetical protein